MKNKISIQELLHWRLQQAEAEAPAPPRATQLLEMTRPWWETWPDRFQSFVERLGRIQVAYGHAMADPRPAHSGHPVPALVVRTGAEVETSVRLLYLNVRGGRLRLRFQLDTAAQAEEHFEATFVCDKTARPMFSALAFSSLQSEYRIDTEISAEVVRSWQPLKVTDLMPFRLILRSNKDGG